MKYFVFRFGHAASSYCMRLDMKYFVFRFRHASSRPSQQWPTSSLAAATTYICGSGTTTTPSQLQPPATVAAATARAPYGPARSRSSSPTPTWRTWLQPCGSTSSSAIWRHGVNGTASRDTPGCSAPSSTQVGIWDSSRLL